MNQIIRGVLIDTVNNTVKAVSLRDNLDTYYKALHCSTIDIVQRTIGDKDKYFTVVCDDEGLLVDDPIISAVDDHCQPMLVGSLFIADADEEEGEMASLSPEEIDYVMDHMVYVIFRRHPEPRCILTQVGY